MPSRSMLGVVGRRCAYSEETVHQDLWLLFLTHGYSVLDAARYAVLFRKLLLFYNAN